MFSVQGLHDFPRRNSFLVCLGCSCSVALALFLSPLSAHEEDPPKPTNLTIATTTDETQLYIMWDKPDSGTVLWYQIERANGYLCGGSHTKTRLLAQGLDPDRLYSVAVRAMFLRKRWPFESGSGPMLRRQAQEDAASRRNPSRTEILGGVTVFFDRHPQTAICSPSAMSERDQPPKR